MGVKGAGSISKAFYRTTRYPVEAVGRTLLRHLDFHPVGCLTKEKDSPVCLFMIKSVQYPDPRKTTLDQ